MFFEHAVWNHSGAEMAGVSRATTKKRRACARLFMNQVCLKDRSKSIPAAAKETESTNRSKKSGGWFWDEIHCGKPRIGKRAAAIDVSSTR